jgi:HD-GYP domain-containing protein (c-di-GMP phosphodiesterase class II)
VGKHHVRLKGVGPGFEGKTWEAGELLRIGRAPDLEVTLNDSSLSRRHAEILFSGHQGWAVRDLGSTNGTFLNGIRVGQVERKIEERDVIQFGNVVFVVASLEEDGPGSAETAVGNWQVQAATQHSWEEALELLALDITRQTRPGEQLLTLLRAGQHLYQVASLDDLLRMSLQDAVTVLKAQRGAILLADPANGKLVVHGVYANRHESGDGTAFSSTLVERCYRRGESLLCNDVSTDPELLRAMSVTHGAMTSVICALLRTPRKHLGVLHLDRGPSQEPFTPEDLHLADGLAAGMSASVASAQLIQEKQRNVFIQTVIALAQTLELRDPYTSGHADRVTDYALLLAEELKLSVPERQSLQLATPLHDIGKIGVSDLVLQKQSVLTPEEFEQMKTHPAKGAILLQSIPDLAGLVPIVRSHHERWDGAGYPDGLAGDQIPYLARIIAVADTFDALTFDTPYRVGMPLDVAFKEIREGAGTQFDPDCARAFLRLRSRLEQQFQQRTRVRGAVPVQGVLCRN